VQELIIVMAGMMSPVICTDDVSGCGDDTSVARMTC